ncbi:hypothetical protein HAP41_0000028995 [Bradyrhizobium barranii subsp. apii]|uniref:Uncharacterized protein n=1 Tax=Bradyrhizobium barranii subsp. apii TaxID=2819348 RepID=A0A8T5VIR5_9BRAD|nr:hypothetical protein [Bradyrhizobium barranii]UPT84399.1 hypothetical protein HAP41_0000028995 [Bradyrhizobium barranii subsp. apii]
MVEENKVTLESLQFVLGCVPFDVAQAHPDQVKLVEALKDVLVKQAHSDTNDSTAKLMWRDGEASAALTAPPAAMKPLREAMRKVKYDRRIREGTTKRNIAKLVDDPPTWLASVSSSWLIFEAVCISASKVARSASCCGLAPSTGVVKLGGLMFRDIR